MSDVNESQVPVDSTEPQNENSESSDERRAEGEAGDLTPGQEHQSADQTDGTEMIEVREVVEGSDSSKKPLTEQQSSQVKEDDEPKLNVNGEVEHIQGEGDAKKEKEEEMTCEPDSNQADDNKSCEGDKSPSKVDTSPTDKDSDIGASGQPSKDDVGSKGNDVEEDSDCESFATAEGTEGEEEEETEDEKLPQRRRRAREDDSDLLEEEEVEEEEDREGEKEEDGEGEEEEDGEGEEEKDGEGEEEEDREGEEEEVREGEEGEEEEERKEAEEREEKGTGE